MNRHGRARWPSDDACPYSDVDLAQRCGDGCSVALAWVLRNFGGDVRRAMRRYRLSDAESEEAEARLWARLLVGLDGERPRILTFAGTGSLRAWLRQCAAREALGVLRRRRPQRDVLPTDLLDDSGDPEDRALAVEHSVAFREAFSEALESLEPLERELLRLCLVEQVSSAELAARHGVHRVTVTRWLGAARSKLARRTGRMLRDRLGPRARVALGQVDMVDIPLDALSAR